MRPETVRRLDELFRTSPVLLGGGPVSAAEIDAAEQQVGVKFTPDYREFLERYGGGMVGSLPVIGLRQAEVMDPETVVEITARFRADGWEQTYEWVIISEDLAGNPIGLTEKGEVWVSDHDFGETVMVAPTFEQFVLQQLKV